MSQKTRYLVILLFFLNINYTYASDSTKMQSRYDSLMQVYEIKNTKNDIANALLLLDSKKENIEERDNHLSRSVSNFQNLMTVVGIIIGFISVLIAFVSVFSWLTIRNKFSSVVAEMKSKLTEINEHKETILNKSAEVFEQIKLRETEYQTMISEHKEGFDENLKKHVKEHLANLPDDLVNKSGTKNPNIESETINTVKDAIQEYYIDKYLEAIAKAFAQKKWPAVITAFDLYIQYEDFPNYEIYYKHGYSLYMQKEYERARDQFNTALSLKADFCESLWGLLMCYEKLGVNQETKALVQKQIEALASCNNPFD